MNVVDRPVIVKSYNPEAAVSRNASPIREVCLPTPTLLFPVQPPPLTIESGARGVSRMNYTHTDLPPATQDEDSEDLALPSIDSFSFDGIVKAIDPAGNSRLFHNPHS